MLSVNVRIIFRCHWIIFKNREGKNWRVRWKSSQSRKMTWSLSSLKKILLEIVIVLNLLLFIVFSLIIIIAIISTSLPHHPILSQLLHLQLFHYLQPHLFLLTLLYHRQQFLTSLIFLYLSLSPDLLLENLSLSSFYFCNGFNHDYLFFEQSRYSLKE